IEEAKIKGLTYSRQIKASVELINKRTGQTIADEIFLFNLPEMTSEGTFIVSGIERGIVNQLLRSPGAYFTSANDLSTGRDFYQAEIRPLRGSWLEFFVGRKNVIFARIDKRRKFPATVLLRAVGLADDKSLIREFTDFIQPTIDADSTKTQEEAVLEFYRKMRPGEPAVFETAQKLLRDRFFDLNSYELGRVGRYKINKKFGLKLNDSEKDNWVLNKQDLLATMKYLISLQKNEPGFVTDDIDHLGNRRLRQVGEIITRVALKPAVARFERMIKERMSLVSTKDRVSPGQVINPQALTNAINSFFRTNQLSTILDQTNPLSELDILRRVTVVGPGGLSRERASFSIRDIHASQYGRLCPVRSPEGGNIGLVTYLALFAKVNDYGFLETPYRVVKETSLGGKKRMKISDEVVYLTADDEENYYITHTGIPHDEKGYLKGDWVPVRYKGEFVEASVDKVQLIDLLPQQVVGTSASLIPFIAHDEPQRALMGSHMQCQSVPLVKPEAPIVGTGMEEVVAIAMGRTIMAKRSGKVIVADGNEIVVVDESGKNKDIYPLVKFNRTSPNGTCYNQKTIVNVGDQVKKGDLLADGPSSEGGELALGRNLVIAYCQYEGLGFEDAIVISDRLVKEDVLTSIQIHEYEAQVVSTKLGPEEITRDIPNVSEDDLRMLTKEGIIAIGSEVGPNDILVGKIEPRGEKELTAEERLLRAIFGEKAREVKDTSLRVPHGDRGVVIGVSVLDRDKGDELDPGVNKVVKVMVAQLRVIKEGDKLAGRHGNKGVISRIVPARDMPFLEDGTSVDIIISPLSVVARMNLGQILEAHLGIAGLKLGQKYAVPVFEKLPEGEITNLLEKAGFPATGKVELIDGKTGRPYNQKATVGVAYIMKLTHMIDDKSHARSTGPYSLVTQQPLGGKARMGGQRLGEMEVWALESHQAANTLQEMLTVKSDDIIGRTATFQAIIKNQPIPDPKIPESFRVLVKELNGLGLVIAPVGDIVKSEDGGAMADLFELGGKSLKQESDDIEVEAIKDKKEEHENE
ncbi:MAG: DNA-directed RNA polymerase subunit beta, partial [Patescibacteria group bacterium]